MYWSRRAESPAHGVLSVLRRTMAGSYQTWLAALSPGKVSELCGIRGHLEQTFDRDKNHTPRATGLDLIQESAWIGHVGLKHKQHSRDRQTFWRFVSFSFVQHCNTASETQHGR